MSKKISSHVLGNIRSKALAINTVWQRPISPLLLALWPSIARLSLTHVLMWYTTNYKQLDGTNLSKNDPHTWVHTNWQFIEKIPDKFFNSTVTVHLNNL
jgi:hypothetical protein